MPAVLSFSPKVSNFQRNLYSNTGRRHPALRNPEKPFLSREGLQGPLALLYPECSSPVLNRSWGLHPAAPRSWSRRRAARTETLPCSELVSEKHGCRPEETLALCMTCSVQLEKRETWS